MVFKAIYDDKIRQLQTADPQGLSKQLSDHLAAQFQRHAPSEDIALLSKWKTP
jgi:hypothetical protein